MADKVTISVDALGGDDAPAVVLDGVKAALAEDPNLEIILCGPADVVEPFAANVDRCEAVATTQFITMAEHPAQAVRKKKDSSLVVGCRLVKEGRAGGFFSAGSTGACLAAGTLVVGRIKGIARPALTTVLPSVGNPVAMTDCGANADCKAPYLVQFAQMAVLYAKRIMNVENPRVALLNIGEEEEKGSVFAQEAHQLLKAEVPEFVGNCEGRDVITGEFDVIVTDGYTGNVTLKTLEGTAKVLFGEIKKVFKASPISMLGALTVKSGLTDLKNRMNPDAFGGAPLLGVKGAVIVGHGSSNAEAIKNGIFATAKIVRSGLQKDIEALGAAKKAAQQQEGQE